MFNFFLLDSLAQIADIVLVIKKLKKPCELPEIKSFCFALSVLLCSRKAHETGQGGAL